MPLTELQSMFKRGVHVWQWLTSCEGIYRYDQWTDQMIADSQACIGDNTKLSESVFGLVDWVYRRGLNFKMSNCNGAVMAKHNKLFESVPAFWDGDHTEACIAVVKKNKGMFKAQAEEQELAQEEAEAERLRLKEAKLRAKLLKEQQEVISYFNMRSLRALKTPSQLDAILKTLKSDAAKVQFLKQVINMWVIGLGEARFTAPFSSTTDKTVGKVADLTTRLKTILRAYKVIPTTPPLWKAKQGSSPEDFGLRATGEYDILVAKHQATVHDMTARVLEIDKTYGIELLFSWDSVPRSYWDVPLTELQSMFKRGAKFSDEGIDYVLAGLSYDTESKDYILYYIEATEAPIHITDKCVEHSYFKYTNRRGNVVQGLDKSPFDHLPRI